MGLSDWFRRRRDRASAQRRQLEGGAERLEAILPVYAKLTEALTGSLPAWREALKGAEKIARGVIASDDEVDGMIATARRRMATEGWSRLDEVPRLLGRVELARARLSVIARALLPQAVAPGAAPLGYLISCLLAEVFPKEVPVLTPPRRPTVQIRPPGQRFQVKLLYREPTYELRTGIPRTYQLSLEVDAPGDAEARAHAERELRARCAMSGVGWIPEVVSTEVFLGAGVGSVTFRPVAAPRAPSPIPPVIRNAPRGASKDALASYGRSKVAIVAFDPDGFERECRRRELRLEAGARELVGLAADLSTLARRADTPDWAREDAVALAREAMALARRVDSPTVEIATRELQAAPARPGLIDLSGRRVGVLLAAFGGLHSARSEPLEQAQALAARLAVLLQMLSAELQPSALA